MLTPQNISFSTILDLINQLFNGTLEQMIVLFLILSPIVVIILSISCLFSTTIRKFAQLFIYILTGSSIALFYSLLNRYFNPKDLIFPIHELNDATTQKSLGIFHHFLMQYNSIDINNIIFYFLISMLIAFALSLMSLLFFPLKSKLRQINMNLKSNPLPYPPTIVMNPKTEKQQSFRNLNK